MGPDPWNSKLWMQSGSEILAIHIYISAQDNNRQLSSPKSGAGIAPAPPAGRLPPSLTRAPSPHLSVSPQMGAVGGSPSPHQATPPPQHTNIACFGHFERELEYRYCFRQANRVFHDDGQVYLKDFFISGLGSVSDPHKPQFGSGSRKLS